MYFATVLKPKFYFLLSTKNTFIESTNSFKHAKHLIWEFLTFDKTLKVLVLPSTLIFAFFVTAYPELEGIRAKLGREHVCINISCKNKTGQMHRKHPAAHITLIFLITAWTTHVYWYCTSEARPALRDEHQPSCCREDALGKLALSL